MFLILGPSDSDEVLYHWLPLVLRHLGSDWNSTSGFLEPLAYRQQIMGLLSLHETIPYKSLSLSPYLHLCIYTYIYLYSFVSPDNSIIPSYSSPYLNAIFITLHSI